MGPKEEETHTATKATRQLMRNKAAKAPALDKMRLNMLLHKGMCVCACLCRISAVLANFTNRIFENMLFLSNPTDIQAYIINANNSCSEAFTEYTFLLQTYTRYIHILFSAYMHM